MGDQLNQRSHKEDVTHVLRKKFEPIKFDYNELMAEFNACAIRPSIVAPQKKEKKKFQLERLKPSDYEESPPKRNTKSLRRTTKRLVPPTVRSVELINTKTNLNSNRARLVSEEVGKKRISQKLNSGKHNILNLKEKLHRKVNGNVSPKTDNNKPKKKSPKSGGKRKISSSTNTPDWNVAKLKSDDNVKNNEISPNEFEFLQIEKSLRMKDKENIFVNITNWEKQINQILENDRKEVTCFKQKFGKLMDEFLTSQDQRTKKIYKILETVKKKNNVLTTPLKDISQNANRKRRSSSQSDGKLLKTASCQSPEDKGMGKALNLYNSMRHISKSILMTPKLNRSSLHASSGIKKSGGASISNIIQKQCLMLHDTPFKS